MGVKAQDIYDVMDRFEAGSATRLKLAWEGIELELEKAQAPAAPAPVILPVAVPASPAAPAAPVAPSAPVSAAAPVPAAPAQAPAESSPADTGTCITAPLVGVFYAAPAPDKDPYVQPGDHVKKGDTVCLLEAMKMMSEVEAPCDAVIEEVLATDGALVEFGAPLIRYRAE